MPHGCSFRPSLRGSGTLQSTGAMGSFGPVLPGTGCVPWRGLARLELGPVCWGRLSCTLWMLRASQDMRGRDLRDGLRKRRRQAEGNAQRKPLTETETYRSEEIAEEEEPKDRGEAPGEPCPLLTWVSARKTTPHSPSSSWSLESPPSFLCFHPRTHERVSVPECAALDCVSLTPTLSIKYP